MTDETRVRERVTEALATITPLVTMSRDGLVIGALDWGVAREPAYETATAAGRTGDLELRRRGGGTMGPGSRRPAHSSGLQPSAIACARSHAWWSL